MGIIKKILIPAENKMYKHISDNISKSILNNFVAVARFETPIYGSIHNDIEHYITTIQKKFGNPKKYRNDNIIINRNSSDPDSLKIGSRPAKESSNIYKISEKGWLYIIRHYETRTDKSDRKIFTLYYIGKDAYINRKYLFAGLINLRKKRVAQKEMFVKLSTIELQNDSEIIETYIPIKKNLVISPNIKEKIDLLTYNWNSEDYRKIYTDAGIQFKSGVMLYGKPGTGKTSIAMYIASKIRADVLFVDLSVSVALYPIILKKMKHFASRHSTPLFIFEEMDQIMRGRNLTTETLTEEANDNIKKVNYLLQILDGVLSINNAMYIATTNYIELFDDAILRKSRFDMLLEIDSFNEQMAKELCDNFEAPYSILKGMSYPINPAVLQGRCIEYLSSKSFEEPINIDKKKRIS